jgi:hypothetical protein
MTDATDLPLSPPPLAADPSSPAEPWQVRFEVLALILVTSVVVAVIAAFFSAHAQLSINQPTFPGAEAPRTDWTEVVRIAGTSANLMAAGALVVALLLVTLGPGDRIGRLGTTVLQGVVGVGLVTAGLAAVSSALTVTRSDDDPLTYASFQTGLGTDGFIGRLSGVAPLLLAAVIAGYVAWCAFSTLGDVPPLDAVVDAEEAGAADRPHAP